jgi:hypothetical protein
MPQDLTRFPATNALFDLLAGEDQQNNRLAGGAIVNYTLVSSLGLTVIKASPGIIYGVIALAGVATSVVDVYDNSSVAAGNRIVRSGSGAVVGPVDLIPDGIGIKTNAGIVVNTTVAAPDLLILWV